MIKNLIFCFLSFFVFSQDKDYNEYHKNINKAEKLFFSEKKVDSALYYYDKVFKDYQEFIFLKDILNAAQIAKFSKIPYEKYIEMGYLFGLKPSHLIEYPLLKEFTEKFKNKQTKKKIVATFTKERKKYLSKIDFDYLDYMYKLAIKDQIDKRDKSYFNSIIKKTTDKLIQKIKSNGFPGEKNVGISDSLIFKEIGKPELDLFEQRKSNKDLFYMNSEEKSLAFKWAIIILVHHPCAYKLYSSILKDQVRKGNLHPRDLGLIHDNAIRFIDKMPNYCGEIKVPNVFLLNMFTYYNDNINIKSVNKLRAEYNIVSVELDEIKKDYESKFGFKLFSGFWNCR